MTEPSTLKTRDGQLPAAYSDRLEKLSLGPLWTARHTLLPQDRGVTRVRPHALGLWHEEDHP